jgi:type IV pilus assembly protein PilB
MHIESSQLKNFLEDSDFLDNQKLEEAFREAEKKGVYLGDLLLKKELISEIDLKKMHAYIMGIPFVDLVNKEIPKKTLQIISETVAKNNNIIIFKKDGDRLRVAMLDPNNIQIIDYLRKKTGFEIVPCLTTEKSIKDALKQYKKSLKAEFGEIINEENNEAEGKDLEKIAEDLPIIKIVDTLLEHAILQSASDIHIEPDEKEVRVRYRVDGVLHDAMNLPREVLFGIVARIKVLSNLKLDEHRIPQDGRFKIKIDDKKISFRVSIIPVFAGEKIVMRVLDDSAQGVNLESLGLLSDSLDRVRRAITQPNGIFLVTGPTGSGKTTTLYTILGLLNKPEVNISTIEDPIEYQISKINQTQVKSKVGMTFAVGLRALLRQDPDIIMVGEIRDKETMQISLNAAMTGHLVLSTLHTNSAAAAIPRMTDMDAEPFLIASTVNTVVAQRLVRKICPDCKEAYKLNQKELAELGKKVEFDNILKSLSKNKKDLSKEIKKIEELEFYRGKGCKTCNNEGYKGRMGIYEVLEVTEEIKRLISENVTAGEIEKKAVEEGMNTMMVDGFIKALKGLTSLEEVLRVTKE